MEALIEVLQGFPWFKKTKKSRSSPDEKASGHSDELKMLIYTWCCNCDLTCHAIYFRTVREGEGCNTFAQEVNQRQ